MKNKNNQCFKWCVARGLNPVERNSEHIKKILREQAKSLNFDIEFPVSLNKFEKQNPEISANVLGVDNKTKSVYPLRNSKKIKTPVNLLLLENKHYVLIKNSSRLLSCQTSKSKKRKFFCSNCLICFTKKELLEKHLEYCENHDSLKTTMSQKGTILQFKNHKHEMRVLIFCYADFESLTKPIQTCQNNPEKSYTTQYQKHGPSGFCCCGQWPNFMDKYVWTGTNALKPKVYS